ncbi:hypothetical protein [Stigmatella erecta]|uniref:Uncharacterized protein n=1 Tax=Stigmatella erecta TaxID=83460 RepID=A0A1I0JGT1_9BACT|nr:hypothetical protein [Stigmatella erecta]SEU09422.1 hypothetical protein SAMN05443639_107261 [Stigmatella erecta]
MKIDGNMMGPRMSTNLTVNKQTPNNEFGHRVQAGLNAAAGAVSSGVGMATSMIPGGGIVSAAVSSVNTFASGATGSAGTPYAGGVPGGVTGGVTGGATGGVPSVNTTVGTGGVGIPGTATAGGPNYLGGSTGSVGSEFNGELSSMFTQQKELLKLQTQMQNEQQRYQAISNVLKSRHESAKNSIGNIR